MHQKRAERLREAAITEIKAIARRQMAEQGQAALSLGAIARAMGMTTPALYRYFDRRDALITELIIDGYRALALILEQADAATPSADYAARFEALARAYHDWAVAHPHEYALIYGTPIPGYHAPRERTVPVAARILLVFGMLFKAAWEAGYLGIPAAYTTMSPELRETAVQLMSDLSRDVHAPELLLTTLTVRGLLHSLVWAELYGHFPPGVTESGELYNLEVMAISARLGLAGHSGQAPAKTRQK
ncbi:MAG: TetR/AcrR family transcriptional regulator [Roseiflexaceae bacterium]